MIMESKLMKAVCLMAAATVSARSIPRQTAPNSCPPFTNGTFKVNQYQLYPENADWDTKNCLVYFGVLFNSSVAVYDLYKDLMVDIIEFPGITHNPNLHIGGVGVDPYTGLVSIVVDAANPFATGGRDVSGDNFIMKYDPVKETVLWKLNITAVTDGKYGAFQDVETDSRGNTYVVGTYPGTIMRVDPAGAAIKPWYLPEPLPATTQVGFSGLAVVPGTDILLSNDNSDGQIKRFDMRAEVGVPVLVKRTPDTKLNSSDAIYLPPKYEGKVLLVAVGSRGVTVLRSRDAKWIEADTLGTIPNDPSAGGLFVTAAIEIGGGLFMLQETFGDAIVEGTNAGNRTEFPMVDITAQVEAMLAA